MNRNARHELAERTFAIRTSDYIPASGLRRKEAEDAA